MSTTQRAKRLPRSNPISRLLQAEDTIRRLESSSRASDDALAGHVAEVERLREKLADREQRSSQQTQNVISLRETVDKLKAIIADLEMKVADATGYARALNERLEHDSPVVEVPQTVVSTKAALVRERGGSTPYDRPATGYNEIRYGREEPKPRHWTSL